MTIQIRGLGTRPVRSLGMGSFDGVHLGHQAIVKRSDAVLTVYPHPGVVLGRVDRLALLTTLRERRSLVKRLGVLQFDRNVAALPPGVFLDEICRIVSPTKLVVGYDFHFGRDRAGDGHFLQEWGSRNGVEIDIVSPVEMEGRPVKSSEVRSLVQSGQIAEAVQLLGHPYLVMGQVVKGDGRGRDLGYPTANLVIPSQKLLPPNGVYSGTCELDGSWYAAMIYIGSRPTFDRDQSFEVYVCDYDGDLYGRVLSVQMQRFVREERVFDSRDALVRQIRQDILDSR